MWGPRYEAGLTAEKYRPHVILLDMHLKGIDAPMVARHVKSSTDLQLTKVIAMSGKNGPQLLAAALSELIALRGLARVRGDAQLVAVPGGRALRHDALGKLRRAKSVAVRGGALGPGGRRRPP